MGEVQQPAPLLRRERALPVRNRHVDRHRPIAREHAAPQELARGGIGGELAVAELVSFPTRSSKSVGRSSMSTTDTRRSSLRRRASRSVTVATAPNMP